jgi:serralysin
MTIFIGNSLNNIAATLGAGNLSGFTGGTLAQLKDAIGDIILGYEGDDIIAAGSGNDYINGGDGNDRIYNTSGIDIMDGGNGIDTYLQNSIIPNFMWDMQTGVISTGEIAINFENANFIVGNNTVRGTSAANNITGGGGNDHLEGRGGNDRLLGGNGDDTIAGGLGADILDGGLGTDTLDLNGSTFLILGSVDVQLISGVTNIVGEVAFNFENVIGSIGNNRIFGTNGVNFLNGNGGNDLVIGRGGNDVLTGGSGDDTIDGGIGNDLLFGDAGIDHLSNEGGGADTYTGGTGGDVFTFVAKPLTSLGVALNVAKIVDFNFVEDQIHIDNAAFTALAGGFLASSAFRAGAAAGDATDRIIYNNLTGNLFYDADGTGAAAQQLFAKVGPGTLMSFADFFVI